MKDQIKSHWNGRALGYDKNVRHVIYFRRDKTIWQRIFAEFLGQRTIKILYVGTGPGIVANLIAEMGHDVIEIDISERMLKKATENCATLHNTLDFVQGDAENLPFAEESFDAVVNRYVLRGLGFKEILVVANLNKKLLTTLDYLKYGHCGDQFIVTGVK
jgi:ubiquinone/menaquinone biosynthesis C-methylase UbiE